MELTQALGPECCFAALKLIEQLYKDGQIQAHIFRNILKEYADQVDISKFHIPEKAGGSA